VSFVSFLIDTECKATHNLPTQEIGPMVESLKRSVAGLEPPICSHCDVKMTWYRSIRTSAESNEIVHYFQCANCSRIGEVKTKAASNGNGQDTPPKSTRARRQPPPVSVPPALPVFVVSPLAVFPPAPCF
jgi:hypothetical protein